MTKTNKKVIISYQLNGCPVFRNVYVDENGSCYIKKEGRIVCIDNTPCMSSIH